MPQTQLLTVSGSSCSWHKADCGQRGEHSACVIDQPRSAQLWKHCISYNVRLTKAVLLLQ